MVKFSIYLNRRVFVMQGGSSVAVLLCLNVMYCNCTAVSGHSLFIVSSFSLRGKVALRGCGLSSVAPFFVRVFFLLLKENV